MSGRQAVSEVVLHPGEFFFGGGRTRVRTLLGSCVSMTFWHPQLRIGGMCHYLLPSRSRPRVAGDALDGHYADEAMTMFLRELRGRRTEARDYVIKLFGGGKMFPSHARSKQCGAPQCGPTERATCGDVACKNVEAAHRWLSDHRCSPASEHVGGLGYRQLIFELWSGDVWLRRGTPLSLKEVDS